MKGVASMSNDRNESLSSSPRLQEAANAAIARTADRVGLHLGRMTHCAPCARGPCPTPAVMPDPKPAGSQLEELGDPFQSTATWSSRFMASQPWSPWCGEGLNRLSSRSAADLFRIGQKVKRATRRAPTSPRRRPAPIEDREAPPADSKQGSVLQLTLIYAAELSTDQADALENGFVELGVAALHGSKCDSRLDASTGRPVPPLSRARPTPAVWDAAGECRNAPHRNPAPDRRGGRKTDAHGPAPPPDAVAAEVARWLRESTPEKGYDLVEGRYGWFNRPASTGRGRGTVRPGVSADEVEALIAEAEEIVGGDSLSLELDDRATAAAIGPALEAIGFQPGTAAVHLAYLGGLEPTGHGPAGLRIDDVLPDEPALHEWATVKLQAFADSEAPPANKELEAELVIRRAEMAGQGRALAASPRGRVRRRRGLLRGRRPLRLCARDTCPVPAPRDRAGAPHPRGARSLRARSPFVVEPRPDQGGRPEALYRQLGFTDEVHWRRPWTVSSSGH